ncbi:MAG: crotonase/enoyl-CoA hydratase family protein [Nocardioides sp.]
MSERLSERAGQGAEAAVLTDVRGHVLVVTINRPEAKNAVSGAVAQGIAAAMDRLDSADELRVGVLTGAGGTFCAGMDLKGFLTGDSPMVEGRGFGGLVEAPPRKPLIAAVEGFALAGGFELTLACDLVVAAEDATFGVPEVKRALVAGAGAAMLLPQRIPLAQAMELLLVGDPITSGRAAELGLVNRVVASGAALDAAVELAEKIAANGPLAVAATKQVAREGSGWSADEAWAKQMEILMPVFVSEDAQEGPRAFAEKRAPQWKGR